MAANNAAAAAATVVRTAKVERVFFKNQEVIEGFKVFDTYMNKKREPFALRAKRVSVTILRWSLSSSNNLYEAFLGPNSLSRAPRLKSMCTLATIE